MIPTRLSSPRYDFYPLYIGSPILCRPLQGDDEELAKVSSGFATVFTKSRKCRWDMAHTPAQQASIIMTVFRCPPCRARSRYAETPEAQANKSFYEKCIASLSDLYTILDGQAPHEASLLLRLGRPLGRHQDFHHSDSPRGNHRGSLYRRFASCTKSTREYGNFYFRDRFFLYYDKIVAIAVLCI